LYKLQHSLVIHTPTPTNMKAYKLLYNCNWTLSQLIRQGQEGIHTEVPMACTTALPFQNLKYLTTDNNKKPNLHIYFSLFSYYKLNGRGNVYVKNALKLYFQLKDVKTLTRITELCTPSAGSFRMQSILTQNTVDATIPHLS